MSAGARPCEEGRGEKKVEAPLLAVCVAVSFGFLGAKFRRTVSVRPKGDQGERGQGMQRGWAHKTRCRDTVTKEPLHPREHQITDAERTIMARTSAWTAAYLEEHGVKAALEKAVGGAVAAGGPRPLAHISAALAPPPNPALPSEGRTKFFLGANWKCKLGKAAAVKLCGELNAIASDFPSDVELVVFVPTLLIDLCSRLLDPPFTVGAQNVWDNGPLEEHTGVMTAEALAEFGAGWVLLGHSDRRNGQGETSELIAEKAARSIKAGLKVNLTIGETRAQRDAGEHLTTLEGQLAPVVAALEEADWGAVVLAYEPVWAIGDGATPCTPEEAQVVHAHVRSYLATNVSAEAAGRVRIAYTGSVSTGNAASFRAVDDVDGFVCGRASLVADDFLKVACAK